MTRAGASPAPTTYGSTRAFSSELEELRVGSIMSLMHQISARALALFRTSRGFIVLVEPSFSGIATPNGSSKSGNLEGRAWSFRKTPTSGSTSHALLANTNTRFVIRSLASGVGLEQPAGY